MGADNSPPLEEMTLSPEMIEAGLRVYWDHLPIDGSKEPHDREKVADIFRAMSAAQRRNIAAPAHSTDMKNETG